MDPVLPKDQVKKRFPKLSKKQSIFLALAVVISLGTTLYILFFTGPGTFLKNTFLTVKKPVVTLEKTVKNPFDKEAQYVNPFDPFKSPFYSLKKEETAKKK